MEKPILSAPEVAEQILTIVAQLNKGIKSTVDEAMNLVIMVSSNADVFTSSQINTFVELLHRYAELGMSQESVLDKAIEILVGKDVH